MILSGTLGITAVRPIIRYPKGLPDYRRNVYSEYPIPNYRSFRIVGVVHRDRGGRTASRAQECWVIRSDCQKRSYSRKNSRLKALFRLDSVDRMLMLMANGRI